MPPELAANYEQDSVEKPAKTVDKIPQKTLDTNPTLEANPDYQAILRQLEKQSKTNPDVSKREKNYTEIISWMKGNTDKIRIVNGTMVMDCNDLRTSALIGYLQSSGNYQEYQNCNNDVKDALKFLSSNHPADWELAVIKLKSMSKEDQRLIKRAIGQGGARASITGEDRKEIDFIFLNRNKFNQEKIIANFYTWEISDRSTESKDRLKNSQERTELHEQEHILYSGAYHPERSSFSEGRRGDQQFQVELVLKDEVLAHLFQHFKDDGHPYPEAGEWEGIIENLTKEGSNYLNYFDHSPTEIQLQGRVVRDLVNMVKTLFQQYKASHSNFNLPNFEVWARPQVIAYRAYQKLF